MTWSYTASPATSTRDAVRLEVGDTDRDDPLLFDGEVDYYLGQRNGSIAWAAVDCCRAILRKLSRRVSLSVDGVSKSLNQQYDQYSRELPKLEARAARSSTWVYAGGISQGDKDANEQDTDRVRPAFSRDLFEVIGAEVVNGVTNEE